MEKEQKVILIRITVAAVITGVLLVLKALNLLDLPIWALFLLNLVPYLIAGYDVLLEAGEGIVHGELLDECFLMAVATLGALALGWLSGGDFYEATAVMVFYQLGELFQDLAVERSRKNITELMDLRPEYANLYRGSDNDLNTGSDHSLNDLDTVRTAPEDVPAGSYILVKPGERIPIDGIVVRGESGVDTAALTGESVPRTARPGDELLSGCVNLNSDLLIQTTKEFSQSAVSRILELVENSGERKARSENFITRFARIYTPVVCALAALLAVLPPLLTLLIKGTDPRWTLWLYRALAFLVASCPCALVVSVPLAFFAGVGGAGRNGILVKGSCFLEALSRTDTVVFDKTGTLTRGNFEVVRVEAAMLPESELLELAAHAELDSPHPIGQSLLRAYGRTPDPKRVDNIVNVSGKGVTAVVDGRRIAVGNASLLSADPAGFKPGTDDNSAREDAGCTVVYVAVDGVYAGRILISDELKPTAAEALRLLRQSGKSGGTGVNKTAMLTGDRQDVGDRVAGELGIDEVYGGLLPENKVEQLEKLLDTVPEGRKLAFVGDGINDAPVLVRADIGIAMGGIGSDAAIEAADIVLMDDDPVKIPAAIKTARRSMRIVYENIVFAIGIKLLTLVLVAAGLGGMWLAVFADVGVMVLSVLNAVRALRPVSV
ncbi:MAG: heavy metal translocating P-type ATPase [Clostridia bacterium]|nr:heavy metal translocating P-type ATPase [Clostridia bacterium]